MSNSAKIKLNSVITEDGVLYGITEEAIQCNSVVADVRYTRTQIPLENAKIRKSGNARYPEVQYHVVYKALSEEGNTLYIGRSLNAAFSSRLRNHINGQKTFKDYNNVRIEVAVFTNSADCMIYEQYLIALYNPPLNVDKPIDRPSIELKEPLFELYTILDERYNVCNIKEETENNYNTNTDDDNDFNKTLSSKYINIKRYALKKKKVDFKLTLDGFKKMIEDNGIDVFKLGKAGYWWRFDYATATFMRCL